MAGRRTGTPDTRGEILAAAKEQFAAKGFDRTSVRGVAREAGVDPALIHHYFDGKDGLFAAAMDLPLSPREVIAHALEVPRAQVGETLIRTMLGIWDDPAYQPALIAVFRSLTAGGEVTDNLRRAFLEGMVFPTLRQNVDGPVSERGVALVGSQIIGLIVARYVVGVQPIASMSAGELAALIGPNIQRYLDA